eukprot:gene5474-6158_t
MDHGLQFKPERKLWLNIRLDAQHRMQFRRRFELDADGSVQFGHKKPLGQQSIKYIPVESFQFAASPEDFYEKFARQSRPIVFRNAIKRWPAFRKWKNVDLLTNLYGNQTFNVEFRKQFENVFPVRRKWKLKKFLKEYKEKAIYLDSVFSRNSIMAKDVLLPPQLYCNNTEYNVDNLNLLISSGNTSSALHQDGYENLLSVISGVKEVILYDSKYTKDFKADNFTIAAGVSSLDPENVDLEVYPEMSTIPYYFAKLNPGDMIYIPQFWWHQVRSYHNPNIAVAIWFTIFNFNEEYEKRFIDETEHVIKTTETFQELLDTQPPYIHCSKMIFDG